MKTNEEWEQCKGEELLCEMAPYGLVFSDPLLRDLFANLATEIFRLRSKAEELEEQIADLRYGRDDR